ncbi:hypothetical protein EVC14_016 [Rhizobium phage RHph_I3_18]|nr:hypothetical protein EVC14_016 [Rhizobium phage RHph_I3_18]
MPTYEVEVNGQTFEIDAPDDQAVNLAVRQLQGQTEAKNPSVPGGYSSGPEWTKPLTSFGTGIADMVSGGFADEIGAAVDSAGSQIFPWREPKTYEQALAEGRADQASLEETNPVSSIAGKVTGGVGLGSALAKGGLSLAANAPRSAGLGQMVVRGAGDGAILGSIYGFGAGEDGILNRGWEAGKGALLGGAIGGAIPVVAKSVSSAYRSVMDAMAARKAAEAAGTSPEVASMLSNVLEADGSLGPQGMRNMARAGKEAMLADAGPNARQALDTAIQSGGPGSVSARGAIDARVARSAGDMTTALDDSLGAPKGVFSARKEIADQARPLLREAYEGATGAYAQPINYASQEGQALEKMIAGRVPGDIIRNANRLMQLDGNTSKQILANIADDGSVTFQQLPDVRQVDYITRALRQAAESGEGQGALGGQTQIGAAYQRLAKDIRSQLRGLVPEYGNALDLAADPISRSQAVELGAKAISPSMRTDQFADALDGMSIAEKGAVSQGIRSEIEHRVSQVTRTLQDGNVDAREAIKALKDLSSRANREKVTLAIGQGPANKLFDEVDRIATSFELRAGVAENSKTFARQAVSGRIDQMTAPGVVGKAAQGEPLKAGKRVAQLLSGQTPEKITARQQQIYSELARFLTQPAGQAIPAFRAMTNFGSQTVANQAQAKAIADLLSSAGQRLGYPLSGQLQDTLRK